jgi:hypothetical protein
MVAPDNRVHPRTQKPKVNRMKIKTNIRAGLGFFAVNHIILPRVLITPGPIGTRCAGL